MKGGIGQLMKQAQQMQERSLSTVENSASQTPPTST